MSYTINFSKQMSGILHPNPNMLKSTKEKMEAIMNKVLEKIKKIGIVPVVVLDDAKDAEPLAKALCEGW